VLVNIKFFKVSFLILPILRNGAFLILLLLLPQTARAERYFDLSVNASFMKAHQELKTNTRTSLGIEIGVPITSYFEVGLGHSLLVDKQVFNESYKEYVRSKGYEVPDGEIKSVDEVADTSLNASVMLPLGSVRPFVFGGMLWRTVCQEDTYEDHGCQKQKMSWNAGVGLGVNVTMSLRFKITYRVTPAIGEKKKKVLDEATTIGLTWGI
jgi:hypothetical protein